MQTWTWRYENESESRQETTLYVRNDIITEYIIFCSGQAFLEQNFDFFVQFYNQFMDTLSKKNFENSFSIEKLESLEELVHRIKKQTLMYLFTRLLEWCCLTI